MGRRRLRIPLQVLINNRLVGHLEREPTGKISYRYDASWLAWEHAFPLSLSLPLTESAYTGTPVAAVFENLLPDSDLIRRRVAERVGADGIDAFSLLSAIGRDCVGAMQFLPEGEAPAADDAPLEGEALTDEQIEPLLRNLARAPLGLRREDDFRISVAGAQEKTALLWHDNRWWKPHGRTPTTHLFKTPIGRLPDGIDLTSSVENEWYCLQLAAAFGLPVNEACIQHFGEAKALVITRFDRRLTATGRLLRLPQEDCCQALGVPPTRKYQSDGGPSLADILRLLLASNRPLEDQELVLRAQAFFWLAGATDGHAKNFSIFLQPGGGFRLTPLYDILSAQPSLISRQIERKQMKLALSLGTQRHYRIHEIQARHFYQSAAAAGISAMRVRRVLESLADTAPAAIQNAAASLPPGFPEEIVTTIAQGILERRGHLLERPLTALATN